jgi:hypothetical protein
MPSGKTLTFGQGVSSLGAPNASGTTDRVRLWDFKNTNPSGYNYAIGVEGGHVWFSTDISNDDGGFKYYSQNQQIFRISSGGRLVFKNGSIQNTAWTGVATNYLQVANATAKYATKAYAASNAYVKLLLANTNAYIADVAAASGGGGGGFSAEALDYGFITSSVDVDLNRDYGTL